MKKIKTFTEPQVNLDCLIIQLINISIMTIARAHYMYKKTFTYAKISGIKSAKRFEDMSKNVYNHENGKNSLNYISNKQSANKYPFGTNVILITTLNVTPGAGTITTSSGQLTLRKLTDNNIDIDTTEVLIKDELIQNNISPSVSGDFTFKKSDLPAGQAEQAIVRDGDLILKGEYNDMPMFSATYYVDEEGVFEQKRGDANPKFAYADIASLNETEGRTEYTGGIPTANYFYIKDHLGSTRMTVDENGNQSENVSYLAYGTEIDLGVSSSFTREKFTGKEFDSEGGMGLYYFGRRYLDPEIGLWVSADPKQEFWNAYQYTVNPISHIDIFGLSDVHFMLGGTLYRDKQTGKLNHFISMAKFKAELQSNIKAFKDKGYTVQFDYLNKKTVETALKDNSKFMYSVSHGNKEGEMSGRDIKGNESDVKPGNIEVKEQNVETKWNAYGCELAGGVDEWEPKVYQFRSWNNTETDTKKAMDLMKFEAERDADLADKKEKKSQPDESDKKKNNQTTQKQVKNE